MQKTVLITGGAGFIGSHLARLLLEKGTRVVVLDNFITGNRENIEELLTHKNFRVLEHDIINPISLDDEKINEIYNLACPASPIHYQANPIRTIKVNTIGVMNVLGLAKKHRARVLQASTSEVYGDPLEHPQRETYKGNVNPFGPRACYDEGKRLAEALFYEYHAHHDVDIRVARIFNTYGPRMARDDGRVVSNFITQALKDENITVYGDGKQTRSFCYIEDLVNGLTALMESNYKSPINLGNPTELSIKKIAEQILSLAESKSKIVYKPLPEDDPHKRKPDIALAKEKLHWEPKITLAEGLPRTIAWFKEN